MLNPSTYSHIQKISSIGLIVSALLHLQVRSFITHEGDSESYARFINDYSGAVDIFIVFLHLIAAACFFSQLVQRSKTLNRRFVLSEVFSVSRHFEQLNVTWAGISWPIMIGLMLYTFLSIAMLPPESLSTKAGSWVLHSLFLWQVFYASFAFARHDFIESTYINSANEA